MNNADVLKRLTDALTIVTKYCEITPAEIEAAFKASYESISIPAKPSVSPEPLQPAIRAFIGSMLNAWNNNSQFVDEEGRPIPLPKGGPNVSIETLFRLVNRSTTEDIADFDADQALQILTDHRVVEPDADGNYRIVRRYLRVNTARGAGATSQLAYIAEFAETVAHNTWEGQGGRFCLVARVGGFPKSKMPLINSMLENQGMQFLEHIDKVIEEQKSASPSPEDAGISVGVGVYLLEQDK